MTTPTPKTTNGSKYIFLLLLGLVIGVLATVMALRAIESRKGWQDHFPHAAMHLMQAHAAQLGGSVKANRCAATDSLPHLQALRTVANDLEPAFPGLRDDRRFVEHAGNLRATLDSALASPPLNCEGLAKVTKSIGESCKACHQDFRG
ncbi:hypothetical protein ACW7G0_06720 [Lysobacter sp. A286]